MILFFFHGLTKRCKPARTAQPIIKFLPVDGDPYIVENFPFDKYELESCPLTAALLAHKHGVCWPVYVPGSAGGGVNNLGEPFGYLKVTFFFYFALYPTHTSGFLSVGQQCFINGEFSGASIQLSRLVESIG